MKNKYYIEINNEKISYSIKKTKRKTIAITVDMSGDVKVTAPLRVSERYIKELVQKKSEWIINKINEVIEKNSNIVCRQFVDGENILYLGKEYALKIIEKNDCKSVVLKTEDFIQVYIPVGLTEEDRKQVVKGELIKWYKQCFADITKKRIEKYSLQLKVFPCKVVIKNQKTLWGSCSKNGNINLNWRLVMAPMNIIDYVIVHELCHLKFMNHSKDFWNLVKSILADYQKQRDWLKVNGNRLVL